MSELRERFEKYSLTRTVNHDMSINDSGVYNNLMREFAWQYYKEGAKNTTLTRHTPKHETVSDWEKRTGETYPDDRLVWSWEDLSNMWTIITYEKYKEIMDKNFDSSPYIFIHTEQFETQSKEIKNLLNDIKNEDMQNWMDNGHFSLSEEIRERIQKVVGHE